MRTFQQDPNWQEYLVIKGESAHLEIGGKGTIRTVQPQASVGACRVPRGPHRRHCNALVLETSRPQSTPDGYITFLFISHYRMHLGIPQPPGGFRDEPAQGGGPGLAPGLVEAAPLRPLAAAQPPPTSWGPAGTGIHGDSPASHRVPFQRHCLVGGGWPLEGAAGRRYPRADCDPRQKGAFPGGLASTICSLGSQILFSFRNTSGPPIIFT